MVTATRTPESLVRHDPSGGADHRRRHPAQRTGLASPSCCSSRPTSRSPPTAGPARPAASSCAARTAATPWCCSTASGVNNAAGGTTPFENLPPSQIARVEIVPGPMSSLYGSDALGGVIQLFTRRWPDAPRVTGSVGYGSYDTDQGQRRRVGRHGAPPGSRLNAGYIDIRGVLGDQQRAGPFTFNPDDDGYRNTNVSGNFVHRFAPDQELGLNAVLLQGPHALRQRADQRRHQQPGHRRVLGLQPQPHRRPGGRAWCASG